MNLLIKTSNLGCKSGWSRYTIGGQVKCLKYIGRYELQDAKSRCASLGASVPLPRSYNENVSYLAAFRERSSLHSESVAIGASDHASEGVWRDNGGDLVTYTNWIYNPQQPDNQRSKEHLAEMWIRGGPSDGTWVGRWNDHVATRTVSIICEY